MERLSDSTPVARRKHRCDYCGGIIEVGEKYDRQVNKYDGSVYTWKAHFKCQKICSKLGMFECNDEGVTDDYFYEAIKEEYMDIQSKTNHELYESKDFEYPPFLEQLIFVCEYHKIVGIDLPPQK